MRKRNDLRWSCEGRIRTNSRYVCIGENKTAVTWYVNGEKVCNIYNSSDKVGISESISHCLKNGIIHNLEHKHISRPRSNGKIINLNTGRGVYNHFTECNDEGYKKKDQTLLYAVLNDESKIKTMIHGDLVELLHDAKCLVMTLAKEVAKRRSVK
jgi:hypothetical protein